MNRRNRGIELMQLIGMQRTLRVCNLKESELKECVRPYFEVQGGNIAQAVIDFFKTLPADSPCSSPIGEAAFLYYNNIWPDLRT